MGTSSRDETSAKRTSPLRDWVELLRPADWLKNTIVLAPLVFGQKLRDPASALTAISAFVAFCLLASGFYCINDAIDAPQDRLHLRKSQRPVAAGRIARSSAFAAGCVLWIAGLVWAVAISVPTGLVCLGYCLLQTLYNLRLKRMFVVDVVTLAIGFVLRAMAGGSAIAVPVSIWLVACVFFLCLFLGLIKRLSDLTSQSANSTWQPVAPYREVPELSWMLSVIGTLAVGAFLSYSLSSHTAHLFGARGAAFTMLTPLVIVALFRFYRRALQGLSDRPLDAFWEDHGIQAACLLFGLGSLGILYMPGLDRYLQMLFLL